MRQTFSNKIFDCILIVLSLVLSALTVLSLIDGFEFFSVYLIKIIFVAVSITTFISMIAVGLNGERFSRIFIITVLIFPGVILLNQFFIDLLFYGAYRIDLLQNPITFLKTLGGIALLYFAIKYSKQTKSNQIEDYGILTLGIGIYLISLVLTRYIEYYLNTELIEYPIWKIILKLIIGISISIIGFNIKIEKVKFKKGLILMLILLFIFGLT